MYPLLYLGFLGIYKILYSLFGETIAFLYSTYINIYLFPEYPPALTPCFHHNCKIGKLSRPVVYIQSIQVVLKNKPWNIPFGISRTLVDIIKHIKGIHQNMTAAHSRVQHLNIFWSNIPAFSPYFFQLFLNFRFLLCFLKVVLPFASQFFIRMPFQPQAP